MKKMLIFLWLAGLAVVYGDAMTYSDMKGFYDAKLAIYDPFTTVVSNTENLILQLNTTNSNQLKQNELSNNTAIIRVKRGMQKSKITTHTKTKSTTTATTKSTTTKTTKKTTPKTTTSKATKKIKSSHDAEKISKAEKKHHNRNKSTSSIPKKRKHGKNI